MLKKKKLRKQFAYLKGTNYSCIQFMQHLKNKYTFETKEEEQVNNFINHLVNMNVLFKDIETNIK